MADLVQIAVDALNRRRSEMYHEPGRGQLTYVQELAMAAVKKRNNKFAVHFALPINCVCPGVFSSK